MFITTHRRHCIYLRRIRIKGESATCTVTIAITNILLYTRAHFYSKILIHHYNTDSAKIFLKVLNLNFWIFRKFSTNCECITLSKWIQIYMKEISIKLSSSEDIRFTHSSTSAMRGISANPLYFSLLLEISGLSKSEGMAKCEKYHQKVICNRKTGEITRKNVKPIVFDAINARAGTHQFTLSFNRHHKQACKEMRTFSS